MQHLEGWVWAYFVKAPKVTVKGSQAQELLPCSNRSPSNHEGLVWLGSLFLRWCGSHRAWFTFSILVQVFFKPVLAADSFLHMKSCQNPCRTQPDLKHVAEARVRAWSRAESQRFASSIGNGSSFPVKSQDPLAHSNLLLLLIVRGERGGGSQR